MCEDETGPSKELTRGPTVQTSLELEEFQLANQQRAKSVRGVLQ